MSENPYGKIENGNLIVEARNLEAYWMWNEGYNQAINDADKVLDWIGEVCHPLDAIMQGKEKLEALRKKVEE